MSSNQNSAGMSRIERRSDLRRRIRWIVFLYAALAGGWILASDRVLQFAFTDPEAIVQASMVKGLAFVLVTSALLYGLIRQLGAHQEDLLRKNEDAQDARMKSLRLLESIAESSDDAIFAKNLDGNYLFFNRAAAKFVGKPANAVLGHDDRAIYPAEEAARLMADDRSTIAADTIRRREESLTTAAGPRVFLATVGPLRDGNGKAYGVFGIARDVTDMRRGTHMLAESQRIARLGSLSIDRGSGHLEGTPETFRLFGVAPEYFDGRAESLLKWLPTPDREAMINWINEFAAGRQLDEIDIRVQQPDGELRWIRAIGSLTTADAMIGPSAGATVQDITAGQQSAISLAESEARYRELFEASPLPMWIYDNESLLFLQVNGAAIQRYGFSRDEFLHMTIRDIRPPEEVPELMAVLNRRGRDQLGAGVWRHRTKAGEVLLVQISSRSIELGGRSARFVVAFDVTEQQRTREAMQEQLDELRRWHQLTLGREERLLELKREVNELLAEGGRSPRYASASTQAEDGT